MADSLCVEGVVEGEVMKKLNIAGPPCNFICSTESLYKMGNLTLSTAFAASVLLQISHRFFADQSSYRGEHAVPAISELVDRDISVEYQARKTLYREKLRDPSTGVVDEVEVTRQAQHNNNPYINDRYFGSSIPSIRATLLPPFLPDGFSCTPVNRFSGEGSRIQGFIFMACFFNPFVNKTVEPFQGCQEALISFLERTTSVFASADEQSEQDADESMTSQYEREVSLPHRRSPSSLREEVVQYAATECRLPRSTGAGEFWKEHKDYYRLIWRFAYLVVCTPPSSADIERVFSVARTCSNYNQCNQNPASLRSRLQTNLNKYQLDEIRSDL